MDKDGFVKYDGNFINGKKDGEGIIYFRDGNSFKCVFSNGIISEDKIEPITSH